MERKRYYKVTTKRTTFYAIVEVYSKLLHKVFFGGQKKCIVISIYFDETHPNLDAYSYHEKCNIEGTLTHGEGTIHMLKAAMQFVRTMYRQIAHLPFQMIDLSNIPCATGKISLPHYYMAHHGKTWYEAKFKAQPEQGAERYHSDVQSFLQSLREPLRNNFRTFKNDYAIPSTHVVTLKDLYEKSSTIKELLRYCKAYDCDIYKKWLERVVEEHVPGIRGKSWLIPPTSGSSTSISILELKDMPADIFIYQKGGDLQEGEMTPFLLHNKKKVIQ